MPRASSLAGLSLAAALAAAPAPARAGTFSAVDALREIPPAEKVKCPKTDADPDDPDLETLTLPQALKSLDDLLAQISTPEARRALDSSPVARDPGKASRAAVSALGSKRLNAALGL